MSPPHVEECQCSDELFANLTTGVLWDSSMLSEPSTHPFQLNVFSKTSLRPVHERSPQTLETVFRGHGAVRAGAYQMIFQIPSARGLQKNIYGNMYTLHYITLHYITLRTYTHTHTRAHTSPLKASRGQQDGGGGGGGWISPWTCIHTEILGMQAQPWPQNCQAYACTSTSFGVTMSSLEGSASARSKQSALLQSWQNIPTSGCMKSF